MAQIIYSKEITEKVGAALTDKIGASKIFVRGNDKLPAIEAHPSSLFEVISYLKANANYDFLNSITGTDLMEFNQADKSLANLPWVELYQIKATSQADQESKLESANICRIFQLVYHLFSYSAKHGLVIKVSLPMSENDGSVMPIASIDTLYGNANWLEREVFDLLGIQFLGSKDLRRILLPEDWVGYPLRRDYVQGDWYLDMSTQRPDPIAEIKQLKAQAVLN